MEPIKRNEQEIQEQLDACDAAIKAAQVIADKIGVHRREMHLFCFNLTEWGDPDERPILNKLKSLGYDFELLCWDNDGPPLPEEWGDDYSRLTDNWYNNIKIKIQSL